MTAHTKMLQSFTILHRFCLLFATVWNLKLLLVVVVMAKTWDFFNRSSLNKRSSIRFHPLCSRKIFSFQDLLNFANNCGIYKIMVFHLLCTELKKNAFARPIWMFFSISNKLSFGTVCYLQNFDCWLIYHLAILEL